MFKGISCIVKVVLHNVPLAILLINLQVDVINAIVHANNVKVKPLFVLPAIMVCTWMTLAVFHSFLMAKYH